MKTRTKRSTNVILFFCLIMVSLFITTGCGEKKDSDLGKINTASDKMTYEQVFKNLGYSFPGMDENSTYRVLSIKDDYEDKQYDITFVVSTTEYSHNWKIDDVIYSYIQADSAEKLYYLGEMHYWIRGDKYIEFVYNGDFYDVSYADIYLDGKSEESDDGTVQGTITTEYKGDRKLKSKGYVNIHDHVRFEGNSENNISRCVMVDGILFYDTGYESPETVRCGTMDGTIDSECASVNLPYHNNQGNFGTGYGYQYGLVDGTIEVLIENDQWFVFATEEVKKTYKPEPMEFSEEELTQMPICQVEYDGNRYEVWFLYRAAIVIKDGGKKDWKINEMASIWLKVPEGEGEKLNFIGDIDFEITGAKTVECNFKGAFYELSQDDLQFYEKVDGQRVESIGLAKEAAFEFTASKDNIGKRKRIVDFQKSFDLSTELSL